MLALPLLTVFIAVTALAAGWLAETLGGSLTGRQFLNECLHVLTLRDAVPAIVKTMVFGWLIGASGCYFGMNAPGGAEGVGCAATAGVVCALFLVLVSDVLLVKAIQVLFGRLRF